MPHVYAEYDHEEQEQRGDDEGAAARQSREVFRTVSPHEQDEYQRVCNGVYQTEDEQISDLAVFLVHGHPRDAHDQLEYMVREILYEECCDGEEQHIGYAQVEAQQSVAERENISRKVIRVVLHGFGDEGYRGGGVPQRGQSAKDDPAEHQPQNEFLPPREPVEHQPHGYEKLDEKGYHAHLTPLP